MSASRGAIGLRIVERVGLEANSVTSHFGGRGCLTLPPPMERFGRVPEHLLGDDILPLSTDRRSG